MRRAGPWWRGAVVYQVYLRSFRDGNGDGFGDIAGLRERLDYLAALEVDALWINPWYPSPMADGGYDVVDYRAIHPDFGTLAEAEALITEAHRRGLGVLLDLVPNHTSDQHPWFREAVAAGPGSPARARYWFRPGRGEHGDQPPTNWRSAFGGSAWTRVREPDGSPGEWYLHLFAPEQPDLDWTNEEVHAEFEDVLRFWFDRGVAGFRIDVANAMAKDPLMPDVPPEEPDDGSAMLQPTTREDHPHWDRDEVHEVFRRWRQVAAAYDPEPLFVAEAWVPTPERLARYVRPDELQTAFNFDGLRCPWDAGRLREVIDRNLAAMAVVGAPTTWVLSNHDVVRHVTRYGRASGKENAPAAAAPSDLAVGVRRARAAALLTLALPGSAYVYQGDELGLPEVENLPVEALQDPVWERSGHADRGRDGCRVPIPWTSELPSYGFSPDGVRPWLPQPDSWAALSARAQDGDAASMLTLYRRALTLRRTHPALGDGDLQWLDGLGERVAGFAREPGFGCVVNTGDRPARLPPHREVLLSSRPLAADGQLPADTAVWLTLG